MTRLPLADRKQFDTQDHAVFDRLDRRPQPVNDVYKLLANAPNVANAMLEVSEQLRGSVHLSPLVRELAILFTVQFNGGEYEFAHHRNLALRLGLSDEKIRHVADYVDWPDYLPEERTAVQLAAALAAPPLEVSDDLWSELKTHFTDRAIAELLIVIGWYHLASRINGAAELKLEPWFQPL